MTRAKKYLRVIIIMAFFPGILFGLLMSLKIGVWSGITAGIIFGVCSSILMSSIFLPIDYFLTRNLTAKALDIYQSRELQVKGDFEHVFDNCMNVLKNTDFIKRVTPLKEKMAIWGLTRISNTSFGENIKLEFIIGEHNVIKIKISSNPIMKYTLLDFGKNFRNVNEISNHIQIFLQSH